MRGQTETLSIDLGTWLKSIPVLKETAVYRDTVLA